MNNEPNPTLLFLTNSPNPQPRARDTHHQYPYAPHLHTLATQCFVLCPTILDFASLLSLSPPLSPTPITTATTHHHHHHHHHSRHWRQRYPRHRRTAQGRGGGIEDHLPQRGGRAGGHCGGAGGPPRSAADYGGHRQPSQRGQVHCSRLGRFRRPILQDVREPMGGRG